MVDTRVRARTPEEDGQFVAYYSELIRQMERLHQVQHYSLEDSRILDLRAVMEKHLQRLSGISLTVGHAQQKKAALACRFAHQQLTRFADYAPKASPKVSHRVRFTDTVHSWSAALHHSEAPNTATSAQRHMLRVVVATCGKREHAHSGVQNLPWHDAPLAELPPDLWPAATAAADYNARLYNTSSAIPTSCAAHTSRTHTYDDNGRR